MKKQISVANLVMGAGGLVTILFSFLKFQGYEGSGSNAWGSGFFPLATIPAILGLAMAGAVGAELAGQTLPGRPLTFNWQQIKATWGIVAVTIMVAYLIVDNGPVGFKFGGIMMLLGSIAMCVGSIMGILGKGTELVNLPSGPATATPPPAPPSAPPPPPPPPPPGA